MSPEVLKKYLDQYPMRALADDKGPTGEFITCPVRCAWVQLDKLYGNKKYPAKAPEASVTLILPSSANLDTLMAEARRVASAHFGAALNTAYAVRNPATGEDVQTTLAKSLQWPWTSQAKNKGKPGFSADGSGFFLRATSKFAPVRIIDANKQPIPADDPAVYSGMWALALIRLYPYPKKAAPGQMVHGVGVGIQQLMKIGDDTRFASGGNNDNAFPMLGGGAAAAPAAVAGGDGINW